MTLKKSAMTAKAIINPAISAPKQSTNLEESTMTTETPGTAAPARDSIRPFRVNMPEAALADLRRRLAETRLPEKETVADQSQGVPLKTVQQLLHSWQSDYDWRKVEARLNAVPNFITEIDGLDIHFIHVRSRHENALPQIGRASCRE